MKKVWALPLLWGILHGINDFISGFMLSHVMLNNHEYAFFLVILYAILAFGGQLPLGIWLDKRKQLSLFGITGITLLLFSIPIFFINNFAAIVITGLASAIIHIVGGSVCYIVNKEKATPLGIFTAPGVLGLAMGLLTGNLQNTILFIPFTLVLVLLFLIVYKGFPSYITQQTNSPKDQLDQHDTIMIVLLLFMSFRSLVYDIMNQFAQQYEQGILVIAIAAFAGKFIGGIMADKVGWKLWVKITLPLAFILLQIGGNNVYILGFGIACLQSSVPISLMLIQKALPNMPATATSLSLGTSIALAGLPLFLLKNNTIVHYWFMNKWLWVFIALFCAFLWYKIHRFKWATI